MITRITNFDSQHEYYGLSTDTKPTDAPNSSIFWEIDTKTIYIYNAADGTWVEQFSY